LLPTDSQVVVDREVPHWRKCWPGEHSGSESRRYAADSQNGLSDFDNQLRCYEITTMSLVNCLSLKHSLIWKMHQIWTF